MLLPFLFAVAPAAVLTPTDAPDARCLATFAILASKATGDQLDLAKIGVFYFLGKLDARHPGIDLEAAMREAAPLIVDSYDAEMKRCGGAIQLTAARLTTVGAALQKTP